MTHARRSSTALIGRERAVVGPPRRRASALLLGVCLLAGCAPGASPPAAQTEREVIPPPAPPTRATLPIRRLRRLSSREYDNVVRDLLGDTTGPARSFVEDASPSAYDNGAAGLSVQSDQVADYQRAAEALARAYVASGRAADGGCGAGSSPVACRDAFLDGLAARAYRRPLTEGERLRLSDVFAHARARPRAINDGDAPPPDPDGTSLDGVRASLEVILQSPQFLYREELGEGDAATGTVALTPYETASELSFLLSGSLPDDALWAAAREDRLRAADDRVREARRLLAGPGAKPSMRAFLHRWLATHRLGTLGKDAAFYPSFDRAMAASMSAELDAYYDDAVWSGDGSLRALFTSPRSFADATLAGLYGLPGEGPALAPVLLDPSVRRGVLTRAGFLAVHAAADGSGPIESGVFVLGTVLCLPSPPPPPGIPAVPPPGDPAVAKLTTRQRFDAHVASPTCAGCHARIDGVGFGFEQFDGIGALRTSENGSPIDTTGRLVGSGEIDGPFEGASELADRIGRSELLRACYVKQAYRHAMGDSEPEGDALAWLERGFGSDARMTDVWLALVADPVFATRRFEP